MKTKTKTAKNREIELWVDHPDGLDRIAVFSNIGDAERALFLYSSDDGSASRIYFVKDPTRATKRQPRPVREGEECPRCGLICEDEIEWADECRWNHARLESPV